MVTFSLFTPLLTAPYSEPRLQLEMNSSCAILNLEPPIDRNGFITHYEVRIMFYEASEMDNIGFRKLFGVHLFH